MCRAALEEQEEEEEAEEGPKGPQRGVYPRDFGRQSTKAPVREERGFRCAAFALTLACHSVFGTGRWMPCSWAEAIQ